MRIVLYLINKVKQRMLGESLVKGFMRHGEHVRIMSGTVEHHHGSHFYELADADLAVMIGGQSFEIYGKCKEKVPTLFVDKVFVGRRDWYRMVLGGQVPSYLDKLKGDTARLAECAVSVKPRVVDGIFVIYCGSSQAYCKFHGLGDAKEYDHSVCAHLKQELAGSYHLIYRRKASLLSRDENGRYVKPDNLPPGTIYSSPDTKLAELLPYTHCLVTYGSNAGLEALAAGVPVVMLSGTGVNPAWPLAESRIDRHSLLHPYWPTPKERTALLSKLAQVQFSVADIESGEAWAAIKRMM